jgi:NTP pyrophosphatase (non-canonical NTP hydrolase)
MDSELTMQDAIERYRGLCRRFEKIERRPWGLEGAMIELSKQVGDLAALVMNEERYYVPNHVKSSRELIGDELADIVAQVFRIADYYEIDFVEAYLLARQAEEDSLPGMGG